MKLLFSYLSHYRWRVIGALALAATNQIFSLMDPYIFRKIIDDVAAVYRSDTHSMDQFIAAIWPLALASVGVAFVSRVAKNFQDYVINTVTQKVGANLYSDGIRHSLELPYETFEDQRSGETLGKLQKVRVDVEKLITIGINILFQSIIALIFISVYAFSVHWMVMPLFLLTGPLIAIISSVLSKKIKVIQVEIVRESTGLAGSTTESLRNIELVKSLGLAEQEIAHLNATTEKILKLELKKVRYVRSMAFVQGTCVNLLRMLMVVVLIYLIYEGKITIGQFYSLNIYSFFLFNPLQEIGNVVNSYREAEVSLQNFENPDGTKAGKSEGDPTNQYTCLRSRNIPTSICHSRGTQRNQFRCQRRRNHRFCGTLWCGQIDLSETARWALPTEKRASLLQWGGGRCD
jgi:ATP-binding cassette subfamily B protein